MELAPAGLAPASSQLLELCEQQMFGSAPRGCRGSSRPLLLLRAGLALALGCGRSRLTPHHRPGPPVSSFLSGDIPWGTAVALHVSCCVRGACPGGAGGMWGCTAPHARAPAGDRGWTQEGAP